MSVTLTQQLPCQLLGAPDGGCRGRRGRSVKSDGYNEKSPHGTFLHLYKVMKKCTSKVT